MMRARTGEGNTSQLCDDVSRLMQLEGRSAGCLTCVMNERKKGNMSSKTATATATLQQKRWPREAVVAVLLVTCVLIVGFWEIMAGRKRGGFEPFQLTAEDFRGFSPILKDWSVRALKVTSDPAEPNILAYRLDPKDQRVGMPPSVLVRLVHGYNMCDCMRIKEYSVELLNDTRQVSLEEGRGGLVTADEPASQLQIWKLTSSTGDTSIWVTSMIRAYNLTETSVDVRSMAFPRVNVPDAQGWFPRGFTWSSLRHPVRSTRQFLQAKWNASRCDWLTFLGLRRPAWASEDVLTLVASGIGTSVPEESIDESIAVVRRAHGEIYRDLLVWQASRPAPGSD